MLLFHMSCFHLSFTSHNHVLFSFTSHNHILFSSELAESSLFHISCFHASLSHPVFTSCSLSRLVFKRACRVISLSRLITMLLFHIPFSRLIQCFSFTSLVFISCFQALVESFVFVRLSPYFLITNKWKSESKSKTYGLNV